MVRLPNQSTVKRYEFYSKVAKAVGRKDIGFIAIQHCLKDLPHLLHSLSEIGEVLAVICIPYSIDEQALQDIRDKFTIYLPTMDQLYDNTYLSNIVAGHSSSKDIVLVEVGGYFAQCAKELCKTSNGRIIGIIEDTEAGHRRYASTEELPFPVISVARSQLKAAEDAVIGPSTVFSIEKALRAIDKPIEGLQATVLGYGKIGRGAALALRAKNCVVSIFDTNPAIRIQALAEGHKIPSRNNALENADLIIGASGYQSLDGGDLHLLKRGVVLASCSSKQIEFDIQSIKKECNVQAQITKCITCYASNAIRLLLLRDGMPVNFMDGSIIGPLISIVHAEIILSIKTLIELHGEAAVGLKENSTDIKQLAAHMWLSEFIDERSGRYAEFA